MPKKKPQIKGVTKRFNQIVENLINTGIADSYKTVAQAINWSESGMSSARAEEINVPDKYIKSFENVYKIKIITEYEDQIISEIMTRLLRAEAHAEVSESICAELMSKVFKESFSDAVDRFRSLVQKASERRMMKLNK